MQETVLIKHSYCEPLHSLADRFSAGDSRKQFRLQHNTNKPPELTTNYLPAGLYYSAFSCPLNIGHLLLTETDHWSVACYLVTRWNVIVLSYFYNVGNVIIHI